jgi:hypothetical protein
MFSQPENVTSQETPSVLGKDKTIKLRFGNVKFNAQLLRITDQDEPQLLTLNFLIKVSKGNNV